MKKALLFLSTILLLLSSCSNEEISPNGELTKDNIQSLKVRWYGTKLPDVKEATTRGVADAVKTWNPEHGIPVKFLNTPANSSMIETIKTIAKEWEKYAGIKFNFVDATAKADVRIAFDWNGNDWLNWSYTGSDARYERRQGYPTAVFGGLQYLNKEELRGDVLRVFGQILGLEYEQRHQKWNYNKDEHFIQAYWEGEFEGLNMDWAEIKEYVFDPLTQASASKLMETKEIDEESIMVWPYYSRKETTNRIHNIELSQADKEFIAKLYPKKELPTIQEAWVTPGYFVWTDATKTHLRITELGLEQEYFSDVRDGEQLRSVYQMFYHPTTKEGDYPTNFDGKYIPAKVKRGPRFNTSNVTNFQSMYYGCYDLEEIPFYDTSKGTDFSYMVKYCYPLTSIPQIDTSRGIDFKDMFAYCTSLTSVPPLNTSNGTIFWSMFNRCSSLRSVSLSSTSKGTKFDYMFYGCSSLEVKPIIDLSNATSAIGVFTGTRF